MARCAFLTMDSLDGFVSDDELVREPLARRGWEVEMVPWRSREVEWARYEAVVIRTTWDYTDDPNGFLEVLDEIDGEAPVLFNPLELVRWNLEKTYLRDVERRGVEIVPTLWGRELTAGALSRIRDELGTDDIVVKPVIGANASRLHRLGPGDGPRDEDRAIRDLGDRRYLAQPFVPGVIEEGEFSLFYFDGELSHAILKRPASADFRVQEEHGGRIRPVRVDAALREAGDRAVGVLHPTPLYARVDVVRRASGRYALMELELVEPSLYFRMDERAPDRFADALVERSQRRG